MSTIVVKELLKDKELSNQIEAKLKENTGTQDLVDVVFESQKNRTETNDYRNPQVMLEVCKYLAVKIREINVPQESTISVRAENIARELYSRFPNNNTIIRSYAYCLDRNLKTKDGLFVLNKAKDDPEFRADGRFYKALGDLNSNIGKIDSAIESYQKSITFNEVNKAEIFYRIGCCQLFKKRLISAFESFEASIKNSTHMHNFSELGLAVVQCESGDLRGGLLAANKVYQRQKSLAELGEGNVRSMEESLNLLSAIFIKAGHYDNAIGFAKAAITDSSTNVYGLFLIFLATKLKGEGKGAEIDKSLRPGHLMNLYSMRPFVEKLKDISNPSDFSILENFLPISVMHRKIQERNY